jgi:hypothetical protein
MVSIHWLLASYIESQQPPKKKFWNALHMTKAPAHVKFSKKGISTRAVWKVCGLTLLLQVWTLWRCGDGPFFEVPPLASDALLTTLHQLLENGVTVVLKEPVLGLRSNLSGAPALRDWKVAIGALTEIGGTPLEHPPYGPDLAPCDSWAFPTMKRELRGQNRLFHYPPEPGGKLSAARFREVGEAL